MHVDVMFSLAQDLFARKATGLVREVSLADAFFLVFWAQCPINLGIWILPLYATLLIGADIWQGFLVYVIGALALAAVYAHFTAAMPRSGGEYVFLGRLVNPLLGYAVNWGIMATFTGWFALNGMYAGQMGIVLLGWLTNTDLSWIYASPLPYYLVVTIIDIVAMLLVVIGLKNYLRVQAVISIIGFLGIAGMSVAWLSMGPGGFVSAFNGWASAYVKGDAYHQIIDTAVGLGWSKGGWEIYSFWNTLGISAAVAGVFIPSVAFNAYVAGEMKRAESGMRQLIAMVGGGVGVGISIYVMFYAMFYSMGGDFIRAISWLGATHPQAMTLPINTFLFPYALLLNLSPAAGLLTVLGFFLTGLLVVMMDILVIGRCILAWSFDRILPTMMSAVHPRLRTPVRASVAITVLGNILTYLAITGQGFFVLSAAIWYWILIAFIVVSIVAIAFPFIKKDVYKAMPIHAELAGIPVLSILGCISLGLLLAMIAVYAMAPSFAAVYGSLTPATFITTFVMYASAVCIYFASRFYNRKKGIDVALAFKEIPPA
jgi:APA family basic amino acid/polyamine antiporter